MSVNEALYADVIEGTVRLDGRFEADVVVMMCCYPAHTGNEVSSCGRCGRTALKCLCAVCFNWD